MRKLILGCLAFAFFAVSAFAQAAPGGGQGTTQNSSPGMSQPRQDPGMTQPDSNSSPSAQTDQGNVVFDAPAKHYRLRLTDETDETEVAIDVPLSYVHEQMKDLKTVPDALSDQITIPNK